MSVTEHECFACHGRGKFEPDADEVRPALTCAECGGTGVDVEALHAAYRGAVDALAAVDAALTRVLAGKPLLSDPDWLAVMDVRDLARRGGQ